MLTIHNPLHHLHQGREEVFHGRLVPCHETAQRRGMGPLRTPADDGGAALDAALAQIHTPRYLHFIEHACHEWVALDACNAERDALPSMWPARGMRFDVLPDNFAARLGLFAFDAGTWRAACALETAQAVARGTAQAAFALSRPPGHHAGAVFLAATASSTTPHSRRKRCATTARNGSRCSMSNTTTATARMPSSTPVTTCSPSRSTATR